MVKKTADRNIIKNALETMSNYLSKIYEDPQKYRSFMNENETIDTIRILAWCGEDEKVKMYDWIHWMRNLPC